MLLQTFYDAIDDARIDTLRSLLPHYSSWRDKSSALNLAVGRGMVEAVRLLAPLSDVLQHDGQILKAAVFMNNPEIVRVLMPGFKDHPKLVNEALEHAVKEYNLPVVQAIWDASGDRLHEVQTESLSLMGATRDATLFYQRMAPLVRPEVATAYFERVLKELPPHLPSTSVGQILDPLAPLVPASLADTALAQLGQDAMPDWFRHWEKRQLHAVDTVGNGPGEPRRRL